MEKRYKYVGIVLLMIGCILGSVSAAATQDPIEAPQVETPPKTPPEVIQLRGIIGKKLNKQDVNAAIKLINKNKIVVDGNVPCKGGRTYTMLDFAIKRKQNKIAECLIKNGALLTTRGTTTLHRAVVQAGMDNNKLIDAILENNSSLLNSQDSKGYTPLMRAIMVEGNEKNVKYLLKKPKLDLTKVDTVHSRNALAWAINKRRSFNLIQNILKKAPSLFNTPALFEKYDDEENTILHYMLERLSILASNERKPVVNVYNILMREEYEDNVRDALLVANKYGLMPLHIALRMNEYADIAEKLLTIAEGGNAEFKKKFKTDVLDKLGAKDDKDPKQAPLHVAVSDNFNESVIKRLLALGADPLQEDAEKRTASQSVVKKGRNRNAATVRETLKATPASETSDQALQKDPKGPQIGTPTSKPVDSTDSVKTSSPLRLAGSGEKSQGVSKAFMGLIGIPIVIGIVYGINKILKDRDKRSNEYRARMGVGA